MKTFAVVSRKGGVGKSTITLNLAVASGDSIIIDTDPQASCADWSDRRADGLSPQVLMSPASRIRATLSKSRAECIFVDTQPSAEGSLIQLVTEVDLCIVVVRPGQLELDALGATLAAIKAASAPAVFCVNQAHPQANLLDLQMGLQRHYPVGPIIRSRGDFPASVVKGQSVMEFNPTGKAAMEILAYWSWLQEGLP